MTNGSAPADTQEILKRSVTAGDYNTSPMNGGVFHWLIPQLGSAQVDLPAFWSFARDQVLWSTLYRESMWAAAVGIAIGKIVSQGYKVDSDITLRAKRAQDLFLHFDSGRGYVSGLQKHLLNYLLTGNGGHVEIVRATPALGSRIIGLVPLDTFRARRTGDPDFPIIYRDRLGREHVMREWDVFSISDMPDPADTMYGVGHCSAERAYKSICKLEAIEQYIADKVTGQRALAIHVIGGVKSGDLENAKKTAQADAQARGVTNYLGAIMVAMMGDTPASLVTIPLAELPDGFNRKEEWDISLNTYARCIGVAVQDLQPLSGQGLGTGTQSMVLDESAKGEGLAGWKKSFEYHVNEFALDERTTWAISTYDIRDKEREAKVRIDEATAIQTWQAIGLTPQQAINLGVDRDQLPEEYRPEDLTPGTQLDEGEKPEQEAAEAAAAPPATAPVNPTALPPAPASSASNLKELSATLERVSRQVQEATDQQAQTELARQDGIDTQIVGVLKEIVTLVREPVNDTPPPAPVINIPAPIVHVAAPVVNLPAPVVNIPAPVVNVAPAAVTVKAAEPRPPETVEYEVTERDAAGRVTRWRERTRK